MYGGKGTGMKMIGAREPRENEQIDEMESEESVKFSYAGDPPQPNPLDYRFMYITANRWADTGGGWSVLAILVAGGLCLLPMLVFVLIFGR
jgi:hypothetical protein